MIFGKVYNCRWIIERAVRDHALQVNVEKLKSISHRIADQLPIIETIKSLETLRGLEGSISADYFSFSMI